MYFGSIYFCVAPIFATVLQSFYESLPALTFLLLIIMLCLFFVLGKIKADD